MRFIFAGTASLVIDGAFIAVGHQPNSHLVAGQVKLDDNGFCNTWKGKTANCFTVTSAGTNKWSVMNGATPAAVWSKGAAAPTPTPTRAQTNP